jgi:hypothetical protein
MQPVAVARTRHDALSGVLAILTLVLALPSLLMSHYHVAIYGAYLMPHGLLMGFLLWQRYSYPAPGTAAIAHDQRRRAYIRADHHTPVRTLILAGACAIFAGIVVGALSYQLYFSTIPATDLGITIAVLSGFGALFVADLAVLVHEALVPADTLRVLGTGAAAL